MFILFYATHTELQGKDTLLLEKIIKKQDFIL